MTPERIKLIHSSWEQVQPIADVAAKMFYEKLFELDPTLRQLFNGDLQQQGKKLMNAINLAMRSLDRFEAIEQKIRELGARHYHYGVRDKHYETVANALLWTLQQGLGDQFTPEVRAAWVDMYKRLTTAMQEGAWDETVNDIAVTSGFVERCRRWITRQFSTGVLPARP